MMGFLNNELFPALLGAIFGLVLSVVFDDALRNIKRKIKRRFKRIFKGKNDLNSHLFMLGDEEIDFYVVEGDGDITLEHGSIKTSIKQNSVVLPDDIQEIKDAITLDEEEKTKQNLHGAWNGPLFGLHSYRRYRDGDAEEPVAIFNFHMSDYYTFLATNKKINDPLPSGETIREKYIPYDDLDQLVPFLANGFGVVLVVITGDDQVIMTKRSNDSAVRPGEHDVSVVEGVHPNMDQSPLHTGPCFFKAACRGANEELNLNVPEQAIQFLGYGIDLEYYQWNMIGYVRIEESFNEVKRLRSTGAADKWEAKQMTGEAFTKKNVAKLIMEKDMWATAKVALYWTLKKEGNVFNFNKYLKKVK